MKNPPMNNDLWDAEHPYREVAIAILEELGDRIGAEWKDEEWFELEDLVVEVIASRLLHKSSNNV